MRDVQKLVGSFCRDQAQLYKFQYQMIQHQQQIDILHTKIAQYRPTKQHQQLLLNAQQQIADSIASRFLKAQTNHTYIFPRTDPNHSQEYPATNEIVYLNDSVNTNTYEDDHEGVHYVHANGYGHREYPQRQCESSNQKYLTIQQKTHYLPYQPVKSKKFKVSALSTYDLKKTFQKSTITASQKQLKSGLKIKLKSQYQQHQRVRTETQLQKIKTVEQGIQSKNSMGEEKDAIQIPILRNHVGTMKDQIRENSLKSFNSGHSKIRNPGNSFKTLESITNSSNNQKVRYSIRNKIKKHNERATNFSALQAQSSAKKVRIKRIVDLSCSIDNDRDHLSSSKQNRPERNIQVHQKIKLNRTLKNGKSKQNECSISHNNIRLF